MQISSRIRKRWTPYLTKSEKNRILELDYTDIAPNVDTMFCSHCPEQYPSGAVGKAWCGICEHQMRYVRFSSIDEIKEWKDKQIQLWKSINSAQVP